MKSSSDFSLSLDEATMNPEDIIEELRVRPNLKILNLNHRVLGSEGSKVLFRWLAYGDNESLDEERQDSLSLPQLRLTNINLAGARLGDTGFSSLVEWLECSKKRHQMNTNMSSSRTPDCIRELLLQNNHIEGTSELALSFVSALSFHKAEPPHIFSSLSHLNLSSNPLSSEFKQALLSSLASLPSLRILILTMTGLNATDASAIAAYLGQCRLTDFNASANSIGYRGLKKILKAVKRCWTLERVAIYANDRNAGADDDDDESSDDEEEIPKDLGEQHGWRLQLQHRLDKILSRNSCLKSMVRHQAFELLRFSRLLLLNRRSVEDLSHSELDLLVELVAKETPHHSSCSTHQHNCDCLPTFRDPHPNSLVSIDYPRASNSHFPFTHLPLEIQLMVLSELAPLLSSSQQIRIFEHAINKATLPDLSLRLPSSDSRGKIHRTASGGTSLNSATRGGAFGAVYIANIPEKQRWLELVGCDAYDPGL